MASTSRAEARQPSVPRGATSARSPPFLLAMRLHVGAQDRVHAGQVARALRLEPVQHVLDRGADAPTSSRAAARAAPSARTPRRARTRAHPGASACSFAAGRHLLKLGQRVSSDIFFGHVPDLPCADDTPIAAAPGIDHDKMVIAYAADGAISRLLVSDRSILRFEHVVPKDPSSEAKIHAPIDEIDAVVCPRPTRIRPSGIWYTYVDTATTAQAMASRGGP